MHLRKNVIDPIKKQSSKPCYEIHDELKLECQKTSCRHWIDSKNTTNCVILSARNGPKTLQEVGETFGITRMRVCQIEHKLITNLKEGLDDDLI